MNPVSLPANAGTSLESSLTSHHFQFENSKRVDENLRNSRWKIPPFADSEALFVKTILTFYRIE